MPKGISIDRTKRLREEPRTGHNRWHPDIAPVIAARNAVIRMIELLEERGWSREQAYVI